MGIKPDEAVSVLATPLKLYDIRRKGKVARRIPCPKSQPNPEKTVFQTGKTAPLASPDAVPSSYAPLSQTTVLPQITNRFDHQPDGNINLLRCVEPPQAKPQTGPCRVF